MGKSRLQFYLQAAQAVALLPGRHRIFLALVSIAKPLWWVWLGVSVSVVAHLLLFSGASLVWRTAAAGLILGFTPGLFLVRWLIGRDHALTVGDTLLYSVAAGYGIWIWGVLFLSYLPGGITQTGILIAFDLLALLLGGLAAYGGGGKPTGVLDESQRRAYQTRFRGFRRTAAVFQPAAAAMLWLGLVILLATALCLRFVNLGYSEFQGDEAKVMLPAVGVVQGDEEVLFTYRKGPTEIVLPAGQLALIGAIDEGTARAPFAFGNVICLLAVFALGWRLFGGTLGALAGWLAAMLLAVDGYFIGTTRMVQYQSLIFLMGVFTLYPLARLVFPQGREETATTPVAGYLLLAALFAATSAVTHYEGFLVWLPGLYLCWLLWRRTATLRGLLWAALPALLVGGILLVSFYLPFFRHPAFTDTVDRYTSAVVGDDAIIYNRLPVFAANGTFYSAPYAFLFTIAAGIGGVVLLWWRGRGWRYRLGLLVSSLCVVLAMVGGARTDVSETTAMLLLVAVGIVVLPPIVLPTATATERLLWLWLSIPLLTVAFFLEDPNTHFYIFYTPWMLLCGSVLAWLWQQTSKRVGTAPARLVGGAFCLLCITFFGGYAYAFFVHAPGEVVRHWQTQTVLPSWLMWQQPQNHAIFGVPHHSGWRVVNQLYADGVLQGNYLTNVRHWIPEWYIRNSSYCKHNPEVMLLERLERVEEQAELKALMGDEYHLWGVVHAYGEPRLEIYRNLPIAADAVVHLTAPLPEQAQQPFTRALEIASTELLPPTTPVAYRFGEQLELVGYRLPTTVRVGEKLPLVLIWRGLPALERDYTLFAQVLDPTNRKIGQLDTAPSCDAGPTHEWDVGELAPGYYQIPIFSGEAPGVYPLLIGLYDGQSFQRLPIYGATGEALGDALPLAQIIVKP